MFGGWDGPIHYVNEKLGTVLSDLCAVAVKLKSSPRRCLTDSYNFISGGAGAPQTHQQSVVSV